MHKGYFTMHNVKFKPRKDHPDWIRDKDAVASDIDVLAINPLLNGPDRVIVVSCKSWQAGFDPGYYRLAYLQKKRWVDARPGELPRAMQRQMGRCFVRAIEAATGRESLSTG